MIDNNAPSVAIFRALLDNLTSSYLSILESLSPHHAKVVDAMMRSGGIASPPGISKLSRLSPNAVATYLQRLQASGLIDKEGGGKGNQAHYYIVDRLFVAWYQLRYLPSDLHSVEDYLGVAENWYKAEEIIAEQNIVPASGGGFTFGREI